MIASLFIMCLPIIIVTLCIVVYEICSNIKNKKTTQSTRKKEFKVSEMLDDFIEHQYIEHNYEFCDYVSYEKYGVDESEFIKTIKELLTDVSNENHGNIYKGDFGTSYTFYYNDYELFVYLSNTYDDHISITNETLKYNDYKNKERYCTTVLKERLR